MNEDRLYSFVTNLRKRNNSSPETDLALLEKHHLQLSAGIYAIGVGLFFLGLFLGELINSGVDSTFIIFSIFTFAVFAFIGRKLSLCCQAKKLLITKGLFNLP